MSVICEFLVQKSSRCVFQGLGSWEESDGFSPLLPGGRATGLSLLRPWGRVVGF